MGLHGPDADAPRDERRSPTPPHHQDVSRGFAELAGVLIIETDRTRPLGRATDPLARIDEHESVDGTDQLPTALLMT